MGSTIAQIYVDVVQLDQQASSIMAKTSKVAVIGAGISGLLTARELCRENHRVTVFEQSDRVGGSCTESNPLGIAPNREIVHSSLYKSVRTNLPRKMMEFLDYPFVVREGGDGRENPCHEEVLAFIEKFAEDFGLMGLIRFGARVVRVEMEEGKGWVVEWKNAAAVAEDEVFDAVVVCNGHYTEGKIAEIPGIGKWPGRQVHSQNYRTPEPFKDQVILIIGNGPSAIDISRELASMANQRSPSCIKISGCTAWKISKVHKYMAAFNGDRC